MKLGQVNNQAFVAYVHKLAIDHGAGEGVLLAVPLDYLVNLGLGDMGAVKRRYGVLLPHTRLLGEGAIEGTARPTWA